MAIRLYMDQHVRSAVTHGLRLRGVDVLTAYEDGCHELPDPELLDRATHLDRVIFTQDADFLAEAARRQRAGEGFAGVIYTHQMTMHIGDCIDDLELVAKATDPEELRGAERSATSPGHTTGLVTVARPRAAPRAIIQRADRDRRPRRVPQVLGLYMARVSS